MKHSQRHEGSNRLHEDSLLAIWIKMKRFYFMAVEMMMKKWQEMV